MNPAHLLVIDDNVQILKSLSLLLKDEFEKVDTISQPSRIPEMLWRNEYDIVLLDMNFATGETTGNEGIFWLNEIRKTDPLLPIILITAYGDIDLAVRAVKEGASDFISKPWDPEKLILTLQNAYRLRRSTQEVKKLRNHKKQLTEDLERDYLMLRGSSVVMKNLMDTVDKVAETNANVLILGENGTGKELIAREIHRRSGRKGNIFVGVDVAALSEGLFESEMFGHVKGAFTDAGEDRTGRFENAHEGTLFLDEIGNIPLSLQAKLLQVIQNREVIRVGESKPVQVDIRLITATNKPLKQMVQEGSFREDLYYRLNTIAVEVPPLRERGEDIVELAEYFLAQYSLRYGKEGLLLNPRALNKLREYPWPGNVRELKHTMEKAAILSEHQRLGPEDLYLFEGRDYKKDDSFRLDDVERRAILRVMEKCRGNHSKAAKMLDISRTTLYAKLKKYGI
jgi:two-component system response regulator HydG